MEVFEQIRREYEFGVGTIAGVSRKLGVHRRMVREALCSAEPAAPKPQQRRLRKLATVSDFIDRILRADLRAGKLLRNLHIEHTDEHCYQLHAMSLGWRCLILRRRGRMESGALLGLWRRLSL